MSSQTLSDFWESYEDSKTKFYNWLKPSHENNFSGKTLDDTTLMGCKSIHHRISNLVRYASSIVEQLEDLAKNIPEGEKITILEIGAGSGILVKYLVPFLPEQIVDKYIYTDPYNELLKLTNTSDKKFSFDIPNFKKNLPKATNEKMKQEQNVYLKRKNNEFLNECDKYLNSKSLSVTSKIKLLYAKMNAEQSLHTLIDKNEKNVFIILTCPPPSKTISTDIITLMESYFNPNIKKIFLVRYGEVPVNKKGRVENLCNLDGTLNFFDYIDNLEKFKLWKMTCINKFGIFMRNGIDTRDFYYRSFFIFNRF